MNNYTYRARVIRVVDGDTIDCECDLPFYQKALHRFRLLYCDAPELRGEDKEFGKEVTTYLKQLVEGRECIIVSYKADSFGRWLCTAQFDDIPDLSEHLIQKGFAVRVDR